MVYTGVKFCTQVNTKVFRYVTAYLGENIWSVFEHIYVALNIMKWRHFVRCTKACFVYRITQEFCEILWATLGNDWKCILNYTILNFNSLCSAYTVWRYYTVLLKSNEIFSLPLGIIFGNYFLMVSIKVKDYLGFYFAYFLHYQPIYQKTDC